MIRLDRRPLSKPLKKGILTRDGAETLALQVLAFLADDDERLGRFMAETGMAPDDLRATAGDPETLGAVLSYLAQDESLLLVFTTGAGVDPMDIGAALRALTGDGSDA
jgi:hypothetical protein